MGLDHPWTEPPRPGTVVDVLPGIKWLRMPLPFRLDHNNLWLLEDGAGWTAVDTGIGLEETRALWERVFTETLGGRRSRASSSPTSIPTTWGTPAGSPSAGRPGSGAHRPSGSKARGRGASATRPPWSDAPRPNRPT